jgi:hypothetical protein
MGMAKRIRTFTPALCLAAAVYAVFLFSAGARERSFDFEAVIHVSNTLSASSVTSEDCLAVIPKISQNTGKNIFSPLRLGSLKLFILPEMCFLTSLSKSRTIGKIELCSVDTKNPILVKLRI